MKWVGILALFAVVCLAGGMLIGFEVLRPVIADYETILTKYEELVLKQQGQILTANTKALVWAQAIIETDRDYYSQAVDMGADENAPLTGQEAMELLERMQWTHQQWVDNPQWYDYDSGRLQDERALVRSYARLINLVEGGDRSDQ